MSIGPIPKRLVAIAALVALAGLGGASCGTTYVPVFVLGAGTDAGAVRIVDLARDCSNGTCVCPDRASCAFSCASPPCHVDCGVGSTCDGTCANGECACKTGASCAFACSAPACNVTCEGANPRCNATCANGTCTCGANSNCHFFCASGPCHTVCGAGASCLVTCPGGGVAGTQDCDIARCASGKPTLCADGISIACGTACPGSR